MTYGLKGNAEVFKDFLSSLFRMMLKFPNDVRIDVAESGNRIIVSIAPNMQDFGRLIGMGGVMFQSLKIVLIAMSSKLRVKVFLSRIEPTGREHQPEINAKEYIARRDWPRDEIVELFKQTCASVFEHPTVSLRLIDEGKDASRFYVEIDERERTMFSEEELTDSLSVIFCAIGKANGHKIYVTLTRKGSRVHASSNYTG